MDLSKSLPGFSFTSDAPKAASVCRNLRNYLLFFCSCGQNCDNISFLMDKLFV